jgi:Ca2+-binding EF-hand superfamily protein
MRNQASPLPPPGTVTEDDPFIAAILEKIQTYVFQRRIRGRELFFSFDPLHTGRCTVDQFVRAVNTIAPGVSPNDSKLLAEHFIDECAPHPQIVSYNRFCRRIDEIFMPSNLERTPTVSVPKPGAKLQRGLPSPRAGARAASSAATARAASATSATCTTPGADEITDIERSAIEEEQSLDEVLQKLALLLQTRRVQFRDCFQDCERSDATSLMTPRYSGKVTTAQFRQHFPFMREFGEADVELLIKHYGVGTAGADGMGGAVHFAALDNDVREIDVRPSSGGMSSFGAPPGGARATPRKSRCTDTTPGKPTTVDVLVKIRADISDRRSILSTSAFTEFDKLRRGVCRMHHVKPVLTVLRIELDEDDYQALAETYSDNHGMFRYRDFCKDIVRRDFVLPTPGGRDSCSIPGRSGNNTTPPPSGIETCPPTSSPPLVPSRGPHIQARLHDIEMQIRKQVQSRRLMLRNAFQDFDRVRNGRVTQTQFARIMAMLSINLSEADIEVLCETYGDVTGGGRRGPRDTPVNAHDFKYLDFCAAVDIRAGWLNTPASQIPGPSKYFDRGGRIIPSPLLTARQQSPSEFGGLRGNGDRRPFTR